MRKIRKCIHEETKGGGRDEWRKVRTPQEHANRAEHRADPRFDSANLIAAFTTESCTETIHWRWRRGETPYREEKQ